MGQNMGQGGFGKVFGNFAWTFWTLKGKKKSWNRTISGLFMVDDIGLEPMTWPTASGCSLDKKRPLLSKRSSMCKNPNFEMLRPPGVVFPVKGGHLFFILINTQNRPLCYRRGESFLFWLFAKKGLTKAVFFVIMARLWTISSAG